VGRHEKNLGVAGHEDLLVPADIRKILDAPEFDFDRSAIYADFSFVLSPGKSQW